MSSRSRRPAAPGQLTRRAFLGGAMAVVAAGTGCSARRRIPATVASLTAANPFYIAHRGGGGDWPEMTAYAYQQAAARPGCQALEISVCISADGVLVCSHDPNTRRVTGVDHEIIRESWRTLSTLTVSAQQTTDPDQPRRPLTRFDDVVERYLDDFVLFVEPKVTAAADALMARMVELGQPERVVWKQPVNSARFATAKAHGFTTWGYVLPEPAHTGANLQRLAASDAIDLLGAPRAESDAFITDVVTAARQHGKQTVSWNVRSPQDRQRLQALGVPGMMTSHLRAVLPDG